MRAVRQRVRDDGNIDTDRDVLDWLKFAQSETTGIKLGFSKGGVAELDAQIDAAWRESVDEEEPAPRWSEDSRWKLSKPMETGDRAAMLEIV